MLIAFRADASIDIGTGHVMRCLTLANALVAHGHDIHFICRKHRGHLGGIIEQCGHKLTLLETDVKANTDSRLTHAHWLGTHWQQDADDTIAAFRGKQPDWLVIDHYAIDDQWQSTLRAYCKHIMVIDDLADRNLNADLLLDQNYYHNMESRYDERIGDSCVKLIGPRYAMLREEFTKLRNTIRPRNKLEKLLIFFGGVDQHDLTSTALDSLEGLELKTTVIAGNNNSKANKLKLRCQNMHNVDFHRNVNNMGELMAESDLAIGAGGTTTWERCYLGLPAIVITLAKNQAAVNAAVNAAGASVLAGDIRTTSNDIRTLLNTFIAEDGKIASTSTAASSLMQNHVGVAGVISAMGQLND